MCTKNSQLQHPNWTTEILQFHTSAHFRTLLRPTTLRIQAHRCNLPPRSRSLRARSPSMPTSCNAETKLLPQRRGGDLALTLRRSVRIRCVCCATQVTPRAFLLRCGTELRYTLGSKARIAQSDRCTRADKRPIRPITPCTSRLRAPCSIPLQKRSRSCMPLASPCPLPPVSLRYYQAAMCTKDSKLQHSNWTTESHASAHFRILQYFGRLLFESKRIAATYRRGQEACEDE